MNEINKSLINSCEETLNNKDKCLETKEFIIIKDKISYKIEINIKKNNIILSTLNYKLVLRNDEFSKIVNIKFKTIYDSYQFLINEFSEGFINIKEIINNKFIKLIFIKEGKYNNLELILINNEINKDFLINEIYNIHNSKYISYGKEIKKLKEELKQLKLKEKNNLNELNEDKNQINFNKFELFTELTKNSYCSNNTNNTFLLFKCPNNIFHLIYATDNISIISYNLITQKIMTEIKNAHKNYITNFRHIFIKSSKKDIIMSLSDIDNNLKLWEPNIWECILNLENINSQGFLNSACFLNENDNVYIASSNWNFDFVENIKIFDIKGKKIKEINDSNNKTVYIKSYYDHKKYKYYIVTGNDGCIKSYNYSENKLYHKYNQKNFNNSYYCFIIKYIKNVLKIIGSCFDGYIRIWDFDTGDILKIIYAEHKGLIGICDWDENFLFCGTNDKILKIIDLNKGLVLKKFKGLNDILCTLIKFNHPIYGECLITQGLLNDQIKLWYFKNN